MLGQVCVKFCKKSCALSLRTRLGKHEMFLSGINPVSNVLMGLGNIKAVNLVPKPKNKLNKVSEVCSSKER